MPTLKQFSYDMGFVLHIKLQQSEHSDREYEFTIETVYFHTPHFNVPTNETDFFREIIN